MTEIPRPAPRDPTGVPERFDAGWLALREPADAAARADSLLGPLRSALAAMPAERREILDLGSGTGSTVRWLAPRLAGPQTWVLLDHDSDLLAAAVVRCAGVRDATGAPVEITTRTADLAHLRDAELAGTALVTGSALLDLLTPAAVAALMARCAAAGCAVLMTLSVSGRVELDPPDPLDAVIGAAFDAHQRRPVDGLALLGPDAVEVAGQSAAAVGYEVRTAESPWRLGPGSGALIEAWLDGWLAAAVDQEQTLAAVAAGYRARRSTQTSAGRLSVVVHHRDLVAVPGSAR